MGVKRRHIPFWEGWAKNNIFDLRLGDAVAYLVFYILLPISITCISLNTVGSDNISTTYFYTTILVSALNCVYDGANRRVEMKSLRNLKVIAVCISGGLVSAYCIIEILYILITKTTCARWDYALFSYAFVVIIGVIDFGFCCSKNVTLFEYIDSNNDV